MIKLWRNEGGATAIEYGLICSLVVLACVAGMTLLGGGSNGLWTNKVATPVINALK